LVVVVEGLVVLEQVEDVPGLNGTMRDVLDLCSALGMRTLFSNSASSIASCSLVGFHCTFNSAALDKVGLRTIDYRALLWCLHGWLVLSFWRRRRRWRGVLMGGSGCARF
jgi:hypothetical protein